MFKKPLADIKTFALLRSSDRRKFKARMTERFQLAPEIADTLVPDGLLVRKFRASNGNPGVLYVSRDGDPLWFGIGKGSSSPSDDLIPTVYTLWKYPTLLPALTGTHHPYHRCSRFGQWRRPHGTRCHAGAGAYTRRRPRQHRAVQVVMCGKERG